MSKHKNVAPQRKIAYERLQQKPLELRDTASKEINPGIKTVTAKIEAGEDLSYLIYGKRPKIS